MTDLYPLTALGHPKPAQERVGSLTITENTSLSIVSLSFRHTALHRDAILQGVISVAKFQTCADQWFLIDGYDRNFAKIVKTLVGSQASITDQTDAWTIIEVVGPENLFEKLCNVDLRRVNEGTALRTIIDYISCFVVRFNGSIWVMGERSMAKSLHHAITRAAMFSA